LIVLEVREYLAADGSSPYATWFNGLNAPAAAKVTIAVARMAQGNLSNVKSVGGGLQEYRIDFGPGYRIYFGRDGERLVICSAAGPRSAKEMTYGMPKLCGPITNDEKRRRSEMPLTRDFKETIQERARRDAAFREALLKEAVDALLSGDVETGKTVLRDFINATVGFDKLASVTKKSPKSLMRMLGPKGNPQARNFFEIVAFLQKREGLRLKVRAA
jgi:putative addiction module killer protein